MQEDDTKMKVEFSRIMRDLCNFMAKINKDDNIN